MIKLVKVVAVEPLGDFRLRVRFSDGSAGEHDFADMVAGDGEMVAPLRDRAFFVRVHIEYGVLTWPNGYDIDAIALHQEMEAAGELQMPAHFGDAAE